MARDDPAGAATAASTHSVPPLRPHQAEALEALAGTWRAGRTRAWVVLPPGAGKTRLGLEEVRRHDGPAVVLGPNTAIQSQWEAAAGALGIDAGVDRSLSHRLTALTYQSLAVFDPDAEVDDDGGEQGAGEPPLLSRLHPNGQELVTALREAGPILLVLDECHHLIEVWGRLLGELLAELPRARVLGLTATPPATLTADQAGVVRDLFGPIAYEATIPAAVRAGELAPFAEVAWLTTPTGTERSWLQGQAERFNELTTQLTDPQFGTISFLSWLDRRFADGQVSWSTLVRKEPRLCAAALRMHHHGLLALPPGAGLGEEHRRDPDADDWMVLLDDWITRHLLRSGDETDAAVVAAIKRVLPSVGQVWTRSGIRPGRTPVDRVLARSAAKSTAAVEIVRSEHTALGPRMRTLVLCDHERAGPTLSVDLVGVLDPQSGAARSVLEHLVADPDLAAQHPLLVTGRTVAGSPDSLHRLRDFVATTEPDLAAALVVRSPSGDSAAAATATLDGSWTSREWLPYVTRFFESGGARVLVGTRGLLGEGWDARRVTGLVDLTAATTTTAVVQARGRALRLDPEWPDKVAVNWSVVCVAPEHPKGAADWDRLVRKHHGFLAVDHTGAVIDGVAHLDPHFSPYAPPATETFDAVNARMLVRADDRSGIRELWRVGAPYEDVLHQAAWIRPHDPSGPGHPDPGHPDPGHPVRGQRALGQREIGQREIATDSVPDRADTSATVPAVVAGADRLDVRDPTAFPRVGPAGAWRATLGPICLALFIVPLWTTVPAWLLAVMLLGFLGVVVHALRGRVRLGRDLLNAAAEPPGIVRVAHAVADALQAADLVSVSSAAVRVDVDADGTYRCWLDGVADQEQSELFATALEEALAPIGQPRYVLPRWVVGTPPYGLGRAVTAAQGRVRPRGVVWHPVPSVLGVRRERADCYAAAWQRWVGGGEPVYTGSPEGAGILAAHQGYDPFAVTTVLRRHWD